LPKASVTRTVTGGAITMPVVDAVGCCPTSSAPAAPAVTVIDPEVAAMPLTVSVTVSVVLPPLTSATARVATPSTKVALLPAAHPAAGG
jgi:hypothetical protein